MAETQISTTLTATSDINTKNDNSWRTIAGIFSGVSSISSDYNNNNITAIQVSFVIHSDYAGYFATSTRLNGSTTGTQTYATGRFSGNKTLKYKFAVSNTTVGELKGNTGMFALQFKCYRASGQGTLKVYCKSKNVTVTYFLGDDSSISFIMPVDEEEFKQYTDTFDIQLKAGKDVVLENKTYKIGVKNNFSSNDPMVVFNEERIGTINGYGPFNNEGTKTLVCYDFDTEDSFDSVNIEIIKNDIFSISSVINRYDKSNDEYELAFDGTWVKLDINITTLAESFLNKPIVFTLAVGNKEEKIYVKKENLVKNFKITNKDYFELSSDSNHTVVLSAKEAQTDSDGNPIFPEDSTISEEEEERIPEETNLEIFRQAISIFPVTPILNVYEGGVAIGKFSTGTPENPKFECAYPAVFQYSEGPVEAGIWIDGNTIYRKIITFGHININDTGIYDIGIKYNKINNIIKFYGGCKRGSGAWGPLDYSAINTTSNVSIYIMPSSEDDDPTAEIRIGVGSGSTIEKGVLILEYTLIDENE